MSDQESHGEAKGRQEDAASGEDAVRENGEPSPEAEQPPATGAEAEAKSPETADPPRETPSASPYTVFCVTCGAEMDRGDTFCHACGWDSRVAPKLPPPRLVDPNPSPYNRLAALLLCVLLGFLGLHRFYVGKTGTGLIWLFTLGFLGVGQIFDLVLIATGEFRDADDRRVLRWSDAQVG